MIRITLRSIAVITVVLLLSGCSKNIRVISEWDAGRDNISKRERIAVVAMMPESLQRLAVEQEIVNVMRKSGRNALISSDIPGLSGRLTRETAEPPESRQCRCNCCNFHDQWRQGRATGTC